LTIIRTDNKYLVLIVGPTAVGKTALGVSLAKHFKAEVISADSRQMFREMSIGTAVPTYNELCGIKHYFIQNKSVCEYYNASMFEVDVLELLDTIYKKANSVLMVGGSTLYIDAVCYGIDDLPTIDPKVREQVTSYYKLNGIEYLRRQLKLLDPKHYEVVDLKNPNRMMKAIEISLMTGKPYSTFLTATKKERNFKIIKIGLNCERSILFNRINSRVDFMISKGLVDEVKSLEFARETNALRTVGYREIFDYLDGKITLEEAIEQIKVNTRRYAKRQITWFSRDKNMPWFEPNQITDIIRYIEREMI
jgi:tRNA dimethylallyltransferase